MRFLVIVVTLAGFAAGLQAATTPGTIISTAASASYADSQGQQMPQEASNPSNILVVSSQPERTVMLTVRSLYFGPSTVGRTVKVVGKVFTDANGTWVSDGSSVTEVDAGGNTTVRQLYCKVATTFLSAALPQNQTAVVTGISQADGNGIAMVIPESDTHIQALTPQ